MVCGKVVSLLLYVVWIWGNEDLLETQRNRGSLPLEINQGIMKSEFFGVWTWNFNTPLFLSG